MGFEQVFIGVSLSPTYPEGSPSIGVYLPKNLEAWAKRVQNAGLQITFMNSDKPGYVALRIDGTLEAQNEECSLCVIVNSQTLLNLANAAEFAAKTIKDD